jgi:hypothetical protein
MCRIQTTNRYSYRLGNRIIETSLHFTDLVGGVFYIKILISLLIMGHGGRKNYWPFLIPKPECPKTFPGYLGVVLLINYTVIQNFDSSEF